MSTIFTDIEGILSGVVFITSLEDNEIRLSGTATALSAAVQLLYTLVTISRWLIALLLLIHLVHIRCLVSLGLLLPMLLVMF